MNSKTAKRLLAKARNMKNVKEGVTIASLEYDKLKKKHKTHIQVVKPKRNKRQERIIHESTARIRGRAREQVRDMRPKDKAHTF